MNARPWIHPSAMARVVVACALGACALLVAAAPAAHADSIAAGRDPAGDASDPAPGRDLVAVALGYDCRTGTVSGGVALAGAPDAAAPAGVSLIAGSRTSGGCEGYPQIGLASLTTNPVARWTRFDAPGPPAAEGDLAKGEAAGRLQVFEVTDTQLAGRRVDCVTAVLLDPADPDTVYDRAGPFAFEALPELAAQLARVPSSLRPGQSRTIRLRLGNPGDASTGRIKLAVRGRRGLTARVPRTVRALKPGQRRTVPVKVTLSARAKTATPLRVTASAGRLRVNAEATLYLRRPPKGGGQPSGSSVCAGYAPVIGGVGDIVTFPC